MALQSSGQIKVSEIQSEIGQSASSAFSFEDAVGGAYATINTASASYPNNSAPHQISEWYGYDHSASAAYSNDNYWDFDTSGLGLRFERSAGTLLNTGNDISFSFWVRPEWAASDTNALLLELHNSTANTNNRLFLLYDYGLNRLVARLRTNATNSRGTHWNLNSNSTQTGISSGNWHGSNVGNVNSAGLAHIVLTYDSSATSGSTAFDCYWNGAKMPNKITNLTSTIFNFDYDKISINKTSNNNTNSREAFYDNVAVFHNKLLSQSEITSLYNSGAGLPPTELSLDDNLAFQFEAEADPPVAVSGDEYTTTWSLSLDQGRATAY
jgi:hypothetical protein